MSVANHWQTFSQQVPAASHWQIWHRRSLSQVTDKFFTAGLFRKSLTNFSYFVMIASTYNFHIHVPVLIYIFINYQYHWSPDKCFDNFISSTSSSGMFRDLYQYTVYIYTLFYINYLNIKQVYWYIFQVNNG